MLYSNDGRVDFEGKTFELIAELITLIKIMIKEGVIDESDLDGIVELSTASNEEIHERAKDIIEHLLEDKDSGDTFGDMFGDLL